MMIGILEPATFLQGIFPQKSVLRDGRALDVRVAEKATWMVGKVVENRQGPPDKRVSEGILEVSGVGSTTGDGLNEEIDPP